LLAADVRVAELLALAFLDILDLFHVGIAENGADAIGLAELVLGDVLEGTLGALLDTLGMPSAQVALEGSGDVIVDVDGAEGTGDDTLAAGNTRLGIDPDDAVINADGVCGAVLPTLGAGALAADDGHADDGVRVEGDDSDRRLLWVADTEVLEGADGLAEATP
jgi:hypothetical protein